MKTKLPFLKKGKEEIGDESEETTGLTEISSLPLDEDDESHEEESVEDKSLINKLKAKLASFQKKKKSSDEDSEDDDEEEDEEEGDEEAEKKKKRSKIIRIVIVGALVAFLASDYIFPPDDTEGIDPAAVPALKPRPKKQIPPAAPAPEAKPEETPATEEPTTTTEVGETTPDVPETPAVEEPLPDLSADDSSTTTYTPDDSPVDVTSTDEDSAPSESGTSDTDTLFGEDSSVGDLGGTDISGGDDFTDQILQDLEKQANPNPEKRVVTKYVAPPDYDYRGRGLVYNCQGKHWACVDAPSYKTCEDNSSSTKYLNKPAECYPFNVYETARGCEITQNRMVSSSAKTNFCNE